MVIVPNNFIFVHIPRTGGIALTHCLAKLCWKIPMVINTDTKRHAFYGQILREYPYDLPIYTITRPVKEIVESSYKMIMNQSNLPPGNWKEFVERVKSLSKEEAYEFVHKTCVVGCTDENLTTTFAGPKAKVFKSVQDLHFYINCNHFELPSLQKVN